MSSSAYVSGHRLYMSPAYNWKRAPKKEAIESSTFAISSLDATDLPKLPKKNISFEENAPEKAVVDSDPLDRPDSVDEDVEEIILSPAESKCPPKRDTLNTLSDEARDMLSQAATKGSYDMYKTALTMDARQRALEQRAEELRTLLTMELQKMSSQVSGQLYGWNTPINQISRRRGWESKDDDDNWRMLKNLEAHCVPLEDPSYANVFFSEMRDMFIRPDLDGLPHEIVQQMFPQRRSLFEFPDDIIPIERRNCKKKSNSTSRSKALDATNTEKPESIAKRRLREELERVEFELKKNLEFKFKANPIPETSRAKILDSMADTANKTCELRKKAIQTQKEDQKTCPKCMLKSIKAKKIPCTCDQDQSVCDSRPKSAPHVAKQALELAKYRLEKQRENEKRAGLTENHTFAPKIQRTIPNFSHLHRQFQEKLENSKKGKALTKPKPFKCVEKSHEQKDKVLEKVRQKVLVEEECQRQNLKAQVHKPSVSSQTPPQHLTRSWKLQVEQKELQKEARQLIDTILFQERLEKQKRTEMLSIRLKTYLAESNGLEDQNKYIQQKRKELRKNQISQREDFRKRMEEMKERVMRRPCLFEEHPQAKLKQT